MKKIKTISLVILMSVYSVCTTVQAAPKKAEEVQQEWAIDITEGYDSKTNMLMVDGYLYVASATNNQVLKIDAKGTIVASTTMAGSVGYNGYITYGDGKLFVCQSETIYDAQWSVVGSSTRVQAFSLETLTSLWISEELGTPDSYEVLQSPILYHDGYVYCGTANPSGTSGSYTALTTVDEEIEEGLEEKKIAWQYRPTTTTGFAWSGSYVVDDTLLFVSNDGMLVACDRNTGMVQETLATRHPITSSVVYENGYLYVVTKDGYLLKVQYDTNSYFGGLEATCVQEGGSMTATPTLCDGKIYLGGTTDATDFYAKGFVAVMDATTLTTIYKQTVDGNVQSSFLVMLSDDETTAYFTQNIEVGGVYVLREKEGECSVQELFIPQEEQQNYCNTNVINDGEVWYHTNDSGYIMALTKVAITEVKEPMESLPIAEDIENIKKLKSMVPTNDTTTMVVPLVGVMSSLLMFYTVKKKQD